MTWRYNWSWTLKKTNLLWRDTESSRSTTEYRPFVAKPLSDLLLWCYGLELYLFLGLFLVLISLLFSKVITHNMCFLGTNLLRDPSCKGTILNLKGELNLADQFLLPISFSQVSPVYSEEQLHLKPLSLAALVQLPSFWQGLGVQAVDKYY